ncbi:MAG: hypothetical protein U9O98_04500 [Asgard group archaeon]|nr:hypothetical protein [Asgard group archaeon]
MKKTKLILLSLTSFLLIATSFINIQTSLAGYRNDTVGDAPDPMADITKLEVTEDLLKLTLNGAFNLTNTTYVSLTYNIYVDTSGGEYDPDTTNWDPDHELYEYIAHFDYTKSGGNWFNHSYLWAPNYYIDEGGTKHEGSWWWDKTLNQWVESDPGQQIASIGTKTISFDISDAIQREEPLGSGVVIRAVANSGLNLYVEDIAPNNGSRLWVDEFDNMCNPPGTGTTTPLPAINSFIGFTFLTLSVAVIISLRKKN